jgi:hypothetical protein
MVDQLVRASVAFCWAILPKTKRSVEEVERQIARLADRALRDFREDQAAFAGGGE